MSIPFPHVFHAHLDFRLLDRPERGDRHGGHRQGLRGRGDRGGARLHGGDGRVRRRHQAQAHEGGRQEAEGERECTHAKDQEEMPVHLGNTHFGGKTNE